MSKFIQMHILTSFPPSNLNRDDMGRPKTAKMGGAERLRVSSQSLKRNWRTSDSFQEAFSEHLGIRTKKMLNDTEKKLLAEGIKEKEVKAWVKSIAEVFGKPKENDKTKLIELEQLVHVSPAEQKAIDDLCTVLVAEKRAPKADELKLLRAENSAVDIALFGRMLASSPAFNVEAACQVAHAISVHSVAIEDDYFTAVDDLNDGSEDAGAGHLGETAYAAALYYGYICIDKELLVSNLNGDLELANKAISALAQVATTVTPKGKQNSFASRAYASYVLVEKGAQQPRSLSVAYLKPIFGQDHHELAVAAIEKQVDNFDKVYGDCADVRYSFDVMKGEGSFSEMIKFIAD